MTFFPININTASTGHKLQGKSKDIIIVTLNETENNICFRNWEYVVLLQVRTLQGLHQFEPIDMKQSFKPTKELKQFMIRAKQAENKLLLKHQ
jgi:hypothetical protein